MSRGIAITFVASLAVLIAEAVLPGVGSDSEVTSVLDGVVGDDGLLKDLPVGDVVGDSIVEPVVCGVTGGSGSGLLNGLNVGDTVGDVVSTVESVLGTVTEGSGGGLLESVGKTVGGVVSGVGSVLDSVVGSGGGLPITEVLSPPGGLVKGMTDKVTDTAGCAVVSTAGSVFRNPKAMKVLMPIVRKMTNKMSLGTLIKALAVTRRLKRVS